MHGPHSALRGRRGDGRSVSDRRLYVALLDTLPADDRPPQTAHAVVEMALAHAEAVRAWRDGENIVAVVEMDAAGLEALLRVAWMADDRAADFREPDRGNERTAVAVFPTGATLRLLRRARRAGSVSDDGQGPCASPSGAAPGS